MIRILKELHSKEQKHPSDNSFKAQADPLTQQKLALTIKS